MRNYTKEQINTIAINFLFDLEENSPVFSHLWDYAETEDREAMVESIEESLILRLKLEII